MRWASITVLLVVVLLSPCSLAFSTFCPVARHDVFRTKREVRNRSQVELSVTNTSNSDINEKAEQSRRLMLTKELPSVVSSTLMATTVMVCPSVVSAATDTQQAVESSPASSSVFPPVTHKVFFDLRISRSDGSFYVRDELPNDPAENRVFTGTVTMGLFGTLAPVHVEEFLKYVTVPYDPLDDNPAPCYGRSVFTRLNQSNGLLEGGSIPGLEVTTIGGGSAIRYNDRILPSPVWLEKGGGASKDRLSHGIGKGLLTHRTLDLSPNFEITTRPNADLDSTHFVFGRLLLDEDETGSEGNLKFLDTCQDIPTYSMDRPAAPDNVDRATEELASAVFAKQRDFFRGAAKTLGDTRLGKVYEGKLLRRICVSKVGLLEEPKNT